MSDVSDTGGQEDRAVAAEVYVLGQIGGNLLLTMGIVNRGNKLGHHSECLSLTLCFSDKHGGLHWGR
jgi:hypothetical protein